MRPIDSLVVLKNLKKDLVVIFIVTLIPFLFFIYRLVPDTNIWVTDFFVIDFGSFFESSQYFFWFMSVKILTLMLLSLWYLTCRNTWRYVLFLPIAAEIHKAYTLLKTFQLDREYIPTIFESTIYFIPYILIIYILSNFVDYFKLKPINLVNKEINSQVLKLSKHNRKKIKNYRKELIELMNKKEEMPRKEYLIKLIALRDIISI